MTRIYIGICICIYMPIGICILQEYLAVLGATARMEPLPEVGVMSIASACLCTA